MKIVCSSITSLLLICCSCINQPGKPPVSSITAEQHLSRDSTKLEEMKKQIGITKNPFFDTTAAFHLQEKEGYRELAEYVLGKQFHKPFNHFLDTLRNYNGDEIEYTTLNVVLSYIEENHMPLFIRKHQDNGGFNSTREAAQFAKENFGIKADISAANNMYEWNDYNILIASDSLLRLKGLQYGFVDTQSDENIILIHKIEDVDSIRKLVNKIGYPYVEATN